MTIFERYSLTLNKMLLEFNNTSLDVIFDQINPPLDCRLESHHLKIFDLADYSRPITWQEVVMVDLSLIFIIDFEENFFIDFRIFRLDWIFIDQTY